MALTYDRPVTFKPYKFKTNRDLDHPDLHIKLEPPSSECPARDSNSSNCATSSKLNSLREFKMKFKPELIVSSPPQLTSWTKIHPQHWTKREVLDWIYFVADQEQLDGSRLQGEAYNNFLGRDLCQMDRNQFVKADPHYGAKMYETFRCLINDVSFHEPRAAADAGALDTFNSCMHSEFAYLNRNLVRGVTGRLQRWAASNKAEEAYDGNSSSEDTDLMVFRSDNDDIRVNLQGLGVYSISPEIELPASSLLPPRLREAQVFTEPLLPLSPSHLPELPSLTAPYSTSSVSKLSKRRCSSSSSTYSTNYARSSMTFPKKRNFVSSNRSSFPSSSVSSLSVSSNRLPTSSSLTVPMFASSYISSSSVVRDVSPCRLSSNDNDYLSDDSTSSHLSPYHSHRRDLNYRDSVAMDTGHHPALYSSAGQFPGEFSSSKKHKKQRNNATKNGNHLWEFVRDLLRDPTTNPQLLKWEDKDHGVFRFVQSEQVAKLWGEKKNNPLMTYEKLSRAMRFCRSAGYFDIVPKTGKFPKKLCFRFGAKAHGWKD